MELTAAQGIVKTSIRQEIAMEQAANLMKMQHLKELMYQEQQRQAQSASTMDEQSDKDGLRQSSQGSKLKKKDKAKKMSKKGSKKKCETNSELAGKERLTSEPRAT